MNTELQQLEDDFTRSTNQQQVTQDNIDINIGQLKSIFSIKKTLSMLSYYPALIKLIQKLRDQMVSLMITEMPYLGQHLLDKINIKHIQIGEHQGAISAVVEALQLIKSLINGNISFSDKATLHQAGNRINSQIQNTSTIHPLDKALLKLTQNFSDQGQAKKIKDLLQDTRNQLVSSLNQENGDEQQIQETWEASKDFEFQILRIKAVLVRSCICIGNLLKQIKSIQNALPQNQQDLQKLQGFFMIDTMYRVGQGCLSLRDLNIQ